MTVSNLSNLPGTISLPSSPLQWQSFTALAQNFNIYLQWTVAGRRSAAEFAVEHSYDGSSWVALEGHISRGTSHGSTQFNFLHADALRGINFYRIICREAHNEFVYSDTRRVNVEIDSKAFSLETNAIIDSLIKVYIRKPVCLVIYDTAGKILHRSNYAPGIQTIEISKTTHGICWIDAGVQKEKIIVHLT